MCVTLRPAIMNHTSAMTTTVFNGDDPRSTHISAYQNVASNRAPGANCMLLHFPGTDIELVTGPERTHNFMRDITRGLPVIGSTEPTRGVTRGKDARVQEYGSAYTVVLAERTGDIADALGRVPEDRRPELDARFRDMIEWYEQQFSDYSFVLACFSGDVNPTYPIAVQYFPLNDDELFVPGLDAHDGGLPRIGEEIERSFRVAFGVQSTELPTPVRYTDPTWPDWAPDSVAGFVLDGRGPNNDFVVPLLDLQEGLTGEDLIADLVA